jgi:hypothetical protein
LKVYGVPSLIGYHNGGEIARYLGVKPQSELQSLSIGEIPKSEKLLNWDRMIRLITGTFVAGAAWINDLQGLYWKSALSLCSALFMIAAPSGKPSRHNSRKQQ